MPLQRTLIQVVQSVLGALDSDAVNEIGETNESQQIALLASETYYEMATFQDIPQFQRIDQLIGLNDDTQPTVMSIPKDVTDVGVIRYRHVAPQGHITMERVEYCEKDQFLDIQLDLNVEHEDKIGYNTLPGNIKIPYRKDRGPTLWTTFDDGLIVFDAVDTVYAAETTLHNDHSLLISYAVPEFFMEDDFVIPLPPQLHAQFLAQVKAVASSEQKQLPNPNQEAISRRTRRRSQHLAGIRDGLNNGEGFNGFGKPDRGFNRGRFRPGRSTRSDR